MTNGQTIFDWIPVTPIDDDNDLQDMVDTDEGDA